MNIKDFLAGNVKYLFSNQDPTSHTSPKFQHELLLN